MVGTRDLWLAAYLINSGEKLAKFEIISLGKAKFFFEITQERYSELKLMFFQSELSKMKQVIEELKELAY